MSNPIGWCDCTINPVVGCTKCSPGCTNCYAERFAARLAKNPATAKKYAGVVDERGRWTGKISEPDWSCFEKLPRAPRRVFVGSMTDIFFDEHAPHLPKLFDMMASMPQHTFLLLTKRPLNMRSWIAANGDKIWPNIWLGVTVCVQSEVRSKLLQLMRTPAAKRFVSVEPMLEAIDLDICVFDRPRAIRHLVYGPACLNEDQADYMVDPLADWVICGGENGANSHPMRVEWVRRLRDQCKIAGVPFYFKGWGGSGKYGPALLDGKVWHQFPAQEAADAR